MAFAFAGCEFDQLLCITLLLIIPLFLVILKRKTSKAPLLPPGPYPWPIIGNLRDMAGDMPHVAFAKLSKTYGPLISLKLGSQLVVVGSSPAAASEILKTHDRLLSGRHVPHVSYAKSPERNHVSIGWTYECTKQWNFLRTLCRSELFGPKSIENQSSLRERKAREMVENIESKQGELVNIAQVVFVSVFNFLGNVLFSRDLLEFEHAGNGEEGMSGVIRRVMELWATPNISDLYPFLGPLDLQGLGRKSGDVMKKFFSVWEGILKERKNDQVRGHKDFLDVLLDNEFSDDQINCLLLELFSAGTDTSTSTIEWTLAELLKNEEAMTKVEEELLSEVSNGSITDVQLSKLHFLHACIKESLRLHPPAPLFIPRRAIQTCQVMNCTIPKDTQVIVNAWAIARDPTVFDDPLEFKPERFVNSALDYKGNDFEYLPFGGGRRICPGMAMGVKQVLLSLASLIYHFELSLPPGVLPHQVDMKEKFGVTLQKDEPLVIRAKRIR